MPFRTPHYGLDAFCWGDTYSASKDRKRMIIIDNQLAFLSDIAGEGVISGWEVSVEDSNSRLISISPGMGLIGKSVMQSFGAFSLTVDNNKFQYIYMQARSTEVSGQSGHSNIANILCTDINPPAAPSGLEEDIILRSHDQLTFHWNENSEPDFSYYSVRKETDEYGVFSEIYQTVESAYTDENLSDSTTYNYRVIAVDMSGNQSSASDISLTTSADNRIPLPVSDLQVFPGNESFQIVWDNSISPYTDAYKVVIQPLNDIYENDGTASEEIISLIIDEYLGSENLFGTSYYFKNGLLNYKNYKISVFALNGLLESQEVSYISQPISVSSSNEVQQLSVDFPESIYTGIGLEAVVSWSYVIDAYSIDPAEFQIFFIENGTRSSEPITVFDNEGILNIDRYNYEKNIKMLTFIDEEGVVVHETIKEYTPYLIIVKSVTTDGIVSNGSLFRQNRTPSYELLQAVSDITFERNNRNNNIIISWENPSKPYLSYIKINIDIRDLSNDQIITFVDNLNIGQNTSYIIDGNSFSTNKGYIVTITPVDIWGRNGTANWVEKRFTNNETVTRPKPPIGQSGTYGDTKCIVSWDTISSPDILKYRIYRTVYGSFFEASDFVLVGEANSGSGSFTDYDVINETEYAYFVTSVDIYGEESLNPSDDFYPSTLQIIKPYYSGNLAVPTNLTAQSIPGQDYNVSLSWSVVAGSYDGYEIYRSVGDKYNFRYVGHATANETSFIDENVLLEDGKTYYYFVSTFRNEVNYIITESTVTPSNSILIATVETSNIGTTVDNFVRRDLGNLADPIKEEVDSIIKTHKHNIDGDKDKRIELSSNTSISNWTTFDYQIYSTTESIGNAEYIVKINATVNEQYFTDSNGNKDVSAIRKAQNGTCPIEFTVDDVNNTITFTSPLYSTCIEPPLDPLNPSVFGNVCPKTPYSTEPIMTVEVVDQSAVEGLISSDKINSIFANQVISGRIDESQIPPIHHEGRVDEELIPLKLPMRTFDSYLYSLENSYTDQDRNKIGTSITFYDIIGLGGNRLLAATSNGIMYSGDFGSNWAYRYSFSNPVYRIFLTSDSRIFAITNNNVYRCNNADYTSWEPGTGLSGVQAIRDITEDNLLNLYITTDLGIYKLNKNPLPFIGYSWQQLTIYGSKTSNTYAIIYNPDEDTIWSTNDYGILESVDHGDTWFYITEFSSITKIRRFFKSNEYIFALSDNAVYRSKPTISLLFSLLDGDFLYENYDLTFEYLLSLLDGDFITQENHFTNLFVKISDIDDSICRNIAVFNSKLYITTDKGLLVSNSLNIYTYSEVPFVPAFSTINIKNNIVTTKSLNIINGVLLAGTDRKLFTINSDNKIWCSYEQYNSTVPTVYINNDKQQLAFYYNNSQNGQNVYFDESIPDNLKVEVVNKYNIYIASYRGWARQKFDSEFNVRVNDFLFGESTSNIAIDTSKFSNLVLPVFNTGNSNISTATIHYNNVKADIDAINATPTPTGQTLRHLITKTYNDIDLFLSQIYESSIFITNDDGSKSPFVYPEINIKVVNKKAAISGLGNPITEETDTGAYVNVVNGIFIFENTFDVYDNLKVDIYGCTVDNIGDLSHRDIEDRMELIYSGLPSGLSQIQQINLIKLNTFNKKTWGESQSTVSSLLQSDIIIPIGDEWFDTLNSTVNYVEQNYNNNISLSLLYPSSVFLDDSGEFVLVGGHGGSLKINTDTLDITQLNIPINSEDIVKQIIKRNGIIYILTNSEIYSSSDDGYSWEKIDGSGLPNNLYSIGYVSNNLIIGAEDGIYYRASDDTDWDKNIASNSPVEVLYSPDLLFAIIDNSFYISGDGYNFKDLGIDETYNIVKIIKMLSRTYIATTSGLYSDEGTFYGPNPSLSLVDVLEDPNQSRLLSINDIYAAENKMLIGLNNGSYYELKNNQFHLKEQFAMNSIHKILYINNKVWAFGYDLLQISNMDYPMKLSKGVPI